MPTIEDITLDQTCGACPEQYNAFLDGEQVGYLRLRHGTFTVDFPDCGGETILVRFPEGDGFFRDYERDLYLDAAKSAILNHIKKQSECTIPEQTI